MGFILLWIENLAVSLLLMATLIALAGRFRHRWLRWIIWAPVGIVIFLLYVLLTAVAIAFELKMVSSLSYYPFVALMTSYLVGVIWLCIAGRRRTNGEPLTDSASWPLGKLAIAFGVAVALHLMTLWNMDLEARQQIASLRTEAGALLLSAVQPHVPDGDNAALLYEQAAQALGIALNVNYGEEMQSRNEAWNKWVDSMDKPDFNAKDPELAAFLKQQSGTIALILEATKKPACYFEHDYNRPNFTMELPEMPATRALARLLALHARWKAAGGDYRAAFQDIKGMFVLAKHISNGPLLISTLVGCAIDSMAIDALRFIVSVHQPGLEELDIVKINEAFSYQKIMQPAFRSEEAFRLSALCDIASDIDNLEQFISDGKREPNYFIGRSFLFRIFMLNNEIESNSWYTKRANQLALRPYYQVKNDWRKLYDQIRVTSKSMLVRMFFPAYDNYVEVMARGDAQHRAVELALAMCRYRVKNEKYPEKLDELVPDFMAFVPIDPFDGKPMRLKQTDGKLVIYSIGPDGIDEGGTPYDKQTKKGDIGFELPQAK